MVPKGERAHRAGGRHASLPKGKAARAGCPVRADRFIRRCPLGSRCCRHRWPFFSGGETIQMSYAKIVALVASAARPPLPLRSKAYLRASSSSRKRSGGRSGPERGRRARACGRPRRRRPFHRPRSRAPSQQEEQGEKATDGGRREAEPAGLSVNLEAPWERAGGRWRCRAGVRAGAFLEWRAFFFFFSSFLSRDVGRDGLGGTPAPALPQPLTAL